MAWLLILTIAPENSSTKRLGNCIRLCSRLFDDMEQCAKSAPEKLALAARLRRETTLTRPWVSARLHMSTWKCLNAKLHRWRKTNVILQLEGPDYTLTPSRNMRQAVFNKRNAKPAARPRCNSSFEQECLPKMIISGEASLRHPQPVEALGTFRFSRGTGNRYAGLDSVGDGFPALAVSEVIDGLNDESFRLGWPSKQKGSNYSLDNIGHVK
jgi:hypothetical protein